MVKYGLCLALFISFLIPGSACAADADSAETSVAFLPDPVQSAAARIEVADHAQSELIQVSYILHDDLVGNVALAKLWQALGDKDHPKRVILLLDAFGNKMSRAKLQGLANAGAEIYFFHKLNPLKPWQYLDRLHDKFLVADGRELIEGDRNLENIYFGLGKKPRVSKDIYVSGPPAEEARQYALKMISPAMQSSGEVTRLLPTATAMDPEIEKAFTRYLDKIPRRTLARVASWREGIMKLPAGKVSFFHDLPGAKSWKGGSAEVMYEAIANAKKSIYIENPYIILSEKFQQLFERKAAEGVKIHIMTNSFSSQNQRSVHGAWEKSREALGKIGAEIWENSGAGPKPTVRGLGWVRKLLQMRSEAVLHAKTMVIDGKDSYITTYNLDPRSEKSNTEVLVKVEDPSFAHKVLDSYEEDKKAYEYKLVYAGKQQVDSPVPCPIYFKMLGTLARPLL